uniref:Uncharacterized protein n=1 Tax=Rangifer tarandus platyrhynchus TaxID=3082113 RepID=A0ACB0FAR5_RANTA|nr:unnamed protein product [Rangifer tarandus platyrhynchus]
MGKSYANSALPRANQGSPSARPRDWLAPREEGPERPGIPALRIQVHAGLPPARTTRAHPHAACSRSAPYRRSEHKRVRVRQRRLESPQIEVKINPLSQQECRSGLHAVVPERARVPRGRVVSTARPLSAGRASLGAKGIQAHRRGEWRQRVLVLEGEGGRGGPQDRPPPPPRSPHRRVRGFMAPMGGHWRRWLPLLVGRMFLEFRTQGLAGARTSEGERAESAGETVAGLAWPGLRGTQPLEGSASGPPGLGTKESAAFTSRLNLQGRAERQEEAWRAHSGHLLLREEADRSSASKR